MTQIKDFLGLDIDKVPPEFLQKCKLFCLMAHTTNVWARSISSFTLGLLFFLRRYFPKLPGAILAVIAATLAATLFELPVETIAGKFGEIAAGLPTPSLPHFSFPLFRAVFPKPPLPSPSWGPSSRYCRPW